MENITQVISANLGSVFLFVAAIAVVALILAAVSFVRIRELAKPFAWISGGNGDETDSLPKLLKSVKDIGRDVNEIKADIQGIVLDGKTHFKQIGLVRFNAFEGIAGQQSYTLCLLDDNKNGVLLSSLVGRDFTRSYAIEITKGEAGRKLGDEEARALHEALNRRVE